MPCSTLRGHGHTCSCRAFHGPSKGPSGAAAACNVRGKCAGRRVRGRIPSPSYKRCGACHSKLLRVRCLRGHGDAALRAGVGVVHQDHLRPTHTPAPHTHTCTSITYSPPPPSLKGAYPPAATSARLPSMTAAPAHTHARHEHARTSLVTHVRVSRPAAPPIACTYAHVSVRVRGFGGGPVLVTAARKPHQHAHRDLQAQAPYKHHTRLTVIQIPT
jgi:hypothetical protein